jgi:WD40 repeat protein
MKLLKLISLITLFTLGIQANILFGMEEPRDSDMITVKFVDGKGEYSRNVLAISATIKSTYLPELNGSENYIALYGTNGTFHKQDFDDFIYPLLKADYKNNSTEKNRILEKLAIMKTQNEERAHYKRIKRNLVYFDLRSNIVDRENNRKRKFEDAFSELQVMEDEDIESVYKKSHADDENGEVKDSGLPEIKLKRPGWTTLGVMKMTSEALPYFTFLNNMIKDTSDTKAITLHEQQMTLKSLKVINKIIPLLDAKKDISRVAGNIIEKLSSLRLYNQDILELLCAADYLGCDLLLRLSVDLLAKNLVTLCDNEKSKVDVELIKLIIKNLNFNLRALLVEQLSNYNLLSLQLKYALETMKKPKDDKSEDEFQDEQKKCMFAQSPDGKYIATYFNGEESIKIFDMDTGSLVKSFKTEKNDCKDLRFLLDGTLLKTGDNEFKNWNLQGSPVKTIKRKGKKVEILEVLPNGIPVKQRNASSHLNGNLYLGNKKEGHRAPVVLNGSITFSLDGCRVAYRSGNNLIGKEITILFCSNTKIKGCSCLQGIQRIVDISADGTLVALLDEKNDLLIERIEKTISGNKVGPCYCKESHLAAYDNSIGQEKEAQFSPNNKFLVSYIKNSCLDSSIKVWDMETKNCNYIFDLENKVVMTRFSPNEQLLVTISEDDNACQFLTVYDLTLGKRLYSKKIEDSKSVSDIQFSIDGKSLIYATDKVHIFSIDRPEFNSLETEDIVQALSN